MERSSDELFADRLSEAMVHARTGSQSDQALMSIANLIVSAPYSSEWGFEQWKQAWDQAPWDQAPIHRALQMVIMRGNKTAMMAWPTSWWTHMQPAAESLSKMAVYTWSQWAPPATTDNWVVDNMIIKEPMRTWWRNERLNESACETACYEWADVIADQNASDTPVCVSLHSQATQHKSLLDVLLMYAGIAQSQVYVPLLENMLAKTQWTTTTATDALEAMARASLLEGTLYEEQAWVLIKQAIPSILAAHPDWAAPVQATNQSRHSPPAAEPLSLAGLVVRSLMPVDSVHPEKSLDSQLLEPALKAWWDLPSDVRERDVVSMVTDICWGDVVLYEKPSPDNPQQSSPIARILKQLVDAKDIDQQNALISIMLNRIQDADHAPLMANTIMALLEQTQWGAHVSGANVATMATILMDLIKDARNNTSSASWSAPITVMLPAATPLSPALEQWRQTLLKLHDNIHAVPTMSSKEKFNEQFDHALIALTALRATVTRDVASSPARKM